MTNDFVIELMDYRVYDSLPPLWKKLERLTRFDFYLAWRASQVAANYDMIWAGSERVALPLTLLRVRKPLVVNLHYAQSRARAFLIKRLGLARRWAAVGYISEADREFLMREIGIPADRLFPIEGVKLHHFTPNGDAVAGPIMSLGVTKRDYTTLVAALAELPGYETEIFVSSRFGDAFRGRVPTEAVPPWVHFLPAIGDDELTAHYQHARFVVVPLEDTQQASAGVSVILEASASGKAVIATRTRGTPSYLKEGETGLLVPPQDVQALRKAIQTLWTQPELAGAMGRAGRRFVEANFDPSALDRRAREVFVHAWRRAQATDRKTT